MIMITIISIYQIVYSLRKIKSHVKELDLLVSIRFEEAQLVKMKSTKKKAKRKEQKDYAFKNKADPTVHNSSYSAMFKNRIPRNVGKEIEMTKFNDAPTTELVTPRSSAYMKAWR